nr:hypothetical protein [Tanacetum cinerariifolium]
AARSTQLSTGARGLPGRAVRSSAGNLPPESPGAAPGRKQSLAAHALTRLAQELVTELSERIRSGALKRGDKLPTESAIMEEQGVSRTVVREAISRLQASGLVETRHGIGTFVLDTPSPSGFRIDPATIVTLRDVLAILELRISLEVESAGLAAQRRSTEQLADMRA